jgi:hypothetical protein
MLSTIHFARVAQHKWGMILFKMHKIHDTKGASPYSWVNVMYMILKVNHHNIFHGWHCQKSPNYVEIVWICMKHKSQMIKTERSHHVTGWTWSSRILTIYAQNSPSTLLVYTEQQASSWVSRIGLEHIIQFMRLQNAHESMHYAAHGHILRQRGWNQAGRHIHAAGLGGKVPRIGNMLVTGVCRPLQRRAVFEGVYHKSQWVTSDFCVQSVSWNFVCDPNFVADWGVSWSGCIYLRISSQPHVRGIYMKSGIWIRYSTHDLQSVWPV